MKIVLYGCASYSFFLREVLKLERAKAVEWRAIVMTWRQRPLYDGVLPPEHVFYPHEALNKAMQAPPDLDSLASYPASLHEAIAADKGYPGELTTRPRDYQLRVCAAVYRLYKDYLSREKPDAVFIPIVETYDAMIFYHAARELGITAAINTSARNLGVSFFSATPNEELPPYALQGPPAPKLVEEARAFVREFDRRPAAAVRLTYEPREEELLPFKRRVPFLRKVWTRLPGALADMRRDAVEEPHANRTSHLWYQPRLEFHKLLYKFRDLRGSLQQGQFDIRSAADLPKKFVYFPLQFTPESSINALAPFFVDQTRAVDLLLLRMPSDHLLVVKEHPAMRGLREPAFYKELKRRAGVRLVSDEVPGTELVRRAALTATVTGTSSFEALLMGRPSLLLAKTFWSPWIQLFDSFEGLRDVLREAMREDKAAIQARAVECVTRILGASYDYVLIDPYDANIDPKYTMNRRNAEMFLEALLDHLGRMKAVRKG